MKTTFVLLLIFSAGVPRGEFVPGLPGVTPVLGQVRESQASPGRVTGQVLDADGQPLAGAGATLRIATDSSLVTGLLTDSDGRFVLDGLTPGEYLLHVGLLGYQSRSSDVIEISTDRETVALGIIELRPSIFQLDGVDAVVDRAQVVVEADRTVYNTRAMPIAGAGTAVDVLRAVPELEVDVNNNVRLRGNESAAIHLNGRPTPLRGEQLANFLEQLPGDRIERVEVLPNPSALHDPEGMGGIVNIVLSDDVELGLSGSLSINTSTRNRQGVNGRLNVQRGRLTLFTGTGLNLFRQDQSMYDLRRNLVTDPISTIEQHGWSDNRSDGWMADWTAELRVGEQGTLWSTAWLNGGGTEVLGVTDYGISSEGSGVLERYDRHDDRRMRRDYYNISLGFKQIFEPQRHELTVDVRFMDGKNSTEAFNTRIFAILAGEAAALPPELTLNEIESGNGNRSLQVDYFRPVGGSRLDLGYRALGRDQNNDNLLQIFPDPEVIDPSAETRAGYEYEEMFHSLYGTWAVTAGKFGLQTGLRAEFSETRFDSRVAEENGGFRRAYRTAYPSFNVSYTPTPGQTWRVLYSRRVNRPSAYYLDPFVPPTDPLNRFFGNPDLRPSYTSSWSMDYSRNGQLGTVRVAPFYRSSTDVWERIRTVDGDGVATSIWENAAAAKSYGSNLTLSLRTAGRLSGTMNVSIYRDERDGSNLAGNYRRSATLWSLGGNIGVRLGETLTAQMFANHFPNQSILQGRASGYTFTSLAIRQQVFGTRGHVSLNVSDPLNLTRYDSTSSDATYIQQSSSSMRSRVFTLGFSVNLGQAPQRQSRPAGASNDGMGEGEAIRVP